MNLKGACCSNQVTSHLIKPRQDGISVKSTVDDPRVQQFLYTRTREVIYENKIFVQFFMPNMKQFKPFRKE